MELSISQRREYIVLTAIDLLHEFGINNISTKEIARRLGMSEGLIFKIFPKKNDILLAILERYSLFDKDIFESAITQNDNPIDALFFTFEHFLIYYENYPAITSVVNILSLAKGVPELENKYSQIIWYRFNHIEMLMKAAQDKGIIDKTYDSSLLADNMIYIFNGTCMKWRATNYAFPLKERALQSITLLLEPIVKKP